MIVMKFGGSSVGDAQALGRVRDIVAARLDRRPVIVVSAVGETTDGLQTILDLLTVGQAKLARERMEGIRRDHEALVERTGAGEGAGRAVDRCIERLEVLISGMECLGEVSPRSRDAVLSLGELMAAPLLAAHLHHAGVDAVAVDPRDVIVTTDAFQSAAPVMAACESRCLEHLGPALEEGRVPVVGGFVGATAGGITTTLGRGGSDLTASIVARALHAGEIQFWKDVDGILTADPGIVPGASQVPEVSFQEASELAFLGARVLHPASIKPAMDAGIPVRVMNSHRPGAEGTRIVGTRDGRDGPAVVSIAYKTGQLLIDLYSPRMVGASGFLGRIFEVFEMQELSVDHIATSEVNVSVTLPPPPDVPGLVARLAEVAEVRLEQDVGVVSVVGDGISLTPGIAADVFGALGETNVRLITYGGSGVNISFVVEDAEVPGAVRRLHARLFEGRR